MLLFMFFAAQLHNNYHNFYHTKINELLSGFKYNF